MKVQFKKIIFSLFASQIAFETRGSGTTNLPYQKQNEWSLSGSWIKDWGKMSDLTHFAWSPDGEKIAVLGGVLRNAKVFLAGDGKLLAEVNDFSSGGRNIGFLDDNKILLPPKSSQTAAFSIWNYNKQKNKEDDVAGPEPEVEDSRINTISRFVMDRSRSMIAGLHQTFNKGQVLAIFSTKDLKYKGGNEYKGLTVDITPKGDLIAIGDIDSLVVVDAVSLKKVSELPVGKGYVDNIKWSLDGRFLVVSTHAMDRHDFVKIWNVAEKKVIATLQDFWAFDSVDFSSDGKFMSMTAATKTGGELRLYDPQTFQLIATLCQRVRGNTLAKFSPDSSRLAFAMQTPARFIIYGAQDLSKIQRQKK